MATTKKIRVFSFFGIHLTRREGESEAIGTCTFCGKENHFYVNESSGQWDCKSCGVKGNVYGFLSQLHEFCLRRTKPKDYKELSAWRKVVPPSVFQDWGLAKDGTDWLLPVCNNEGRLVNLHLLTMSGSEKKVLSAPTCALHLIGLSQWKQKGPVYLCEGFWDTYAMSYLTQHPRIKPKIGDATVLGVPGANVFKQEWSPWFENRNVFICFDNDPAGDAGAQRVATMLSTVSRKVVPLHWPIKAPSGTDVSDVLAHYKRGGPVKAWEAITGMLNGSHATSKHEKNVTFQKVIRSYKKFLHVDKNMESALAVVFATAISIGLGGDPLWLFLVGPPGAGKTLFLKSMGDAALCSFLNRLTSHCLVSGFKTVDGSDPSILPTLKGRCLILRDYTEIISMPSKMQEELYGVLRQAYDGQVRTPFGNQITRAYNNCYFSMVAGVTDVIHGDDRATLGERFLKMNFIFPGHDNLAHIKAALESINTDVAVEEQTYALVADFLDGFDFKKKPPPVLPPWVKERLLNFAQLIAYLRTALPRGRDSALSYRSRPEIGTRVAKQLGKLLRCLAVIYRKNRIDAEIYQLGERVGLDTIIGWHKEIVTHLIEKHPTYVSIDDLSETLNIPLTTLRRRLDDLMELKVIKVSSLPSTTVGRKPFGYTVSKTLLTLWQRAKIGK